MIIVGLVLVMGVTIGTGLYMLASSSHAYEKYFSVEPDDVVVDAGSHVGGEAKAWCDHALVVAIEPNPANLKSLYDSLGDHPNVIIVDQALWSEPRDMELYMPGRTTSSLIKYDGAKTRTVRVNTLDNIMENLGLVADFIKMDIEGAELEALEGANRSLMQADRVAIAAYHIRDGEQTAGRVEQILKNYGFDTCFDDGLVYAWR